MIQAPILLFVYNRPIHTQQTVISLLRNELAAESPLYIYSDAAKQMLIKTQWKKLVILFVK